MLDELLEFDLSSIEPIISVRSQFNQESLLEEIGREIFAYDVHFYTDFDTYRLDNLMRLAETFRFDNLFTKTGSLKLGMGIAGIDVLQQKHSQSQVLSVTEPG